MFLFFIIGLFGVFIVTFLYIKKNKTFKTISVFLLLSIILGLIVQLFAYREFSGLSETQWLIPNFIGFGPEYHQGFIGSDLLSFLKQVEWLSWMWPDTNVEMADSYLSWVFHYAISVLAVATLFFFMIKLIKTKSLDTYLYTGVFLIGPIIDISFSIITQSYTFNFLKVAFEFGDYIIINAIDIRDMFILAFIFLLSPHAIKQISRIEHVNKIRKSRKKIKTSQE